MEARTSASDPLRVDFVAAGVLRRRGRLGLTIAPGKNDPGRWKRDLVADLETLAEVFGVGTLVSLMEEHEYEMLGVPNLLECARARGLTVHWFPIKDVSVPAHSSAAAFSRLIDDIVADIDGGATVVVHCRGGLGRSGLVAACALSRCGVAVDEAIAATRAARPGAIETREQEHWVRAFSLHEPQTP